MVAVFPCVVAVAALLLGTVAAWGQMSPGRLSKAHSSLSGPADCTRCHDVGQGAPRFKCLHCHLEIWQSIAQQRGLHATVVAKERGDQDCVRCHSDHNGEGFNLIRWEPTMEEFDHSKTGYVLEGRHAGLACSRCHKPENIPAAERRTIILKDLSRTFLGVSRDCLACHADEHRGQLGADCARCHAFTGWKSDLRFKHADTRYPLSGGHEKVACEKCHGKVEDPKPYVKYVGLAFEACTSCHTDPHRGTFRATCETCHSTSSWKQIRMTAKFDHSKTKYPLLGKHLLVTCGKCHRGADFKKPVAHQRCVDCHKPDFHRGQFQQRADGGECAACHNVEGFKPSLFRVQEHAKTQYSLEGRHAAVACAKCHIPKGPDTLFKIKQTQCRNCHTDVHKGQFAGKPYDNRCEECHTLQGFRPARFSLARHNATRFPLTGAHGAVVCNECHKPTDKAIPAAATKYRFEDRSCTACHQDPHRGQFAERMKKPRADGSPLGCEACHTTESWADLLGFDHSKTAFPLVGAHRVVACERCHRPGKQQTAMKSVDFKSAPTRCLGCHEDVHGGQFAVAGVSPDCSKCHGSLRWKPSLFDHETASTFSLKGAHKGVACALCHKTIREVASRKVLFYKPTPRECVACHDRA